MPREKKDTPFWYERGNFRLIGSTEKDRDSVRLDNILYWTCRIIIALAILLGAISSLIN